MPFGGAAKCFEPFKAVTSPRRLGPGPFKAEAKDLSV